MRDKYFDLVQDFNIEIKIIILKALAKKELVGEPHISVLGELPEFNVNLNKTIYSKLIKMG